MVGSIHHHHHEPVTLETMIPDLLGRYPETRPVLDDYGLKGCGGPAGPHETLGYFARAHEVDADALLARLRTAIAEPPQEPAARLEAIEEPSPGDTIYRRFFTAGVIVILTLGATWGAALLWRIGMHQAFTGVGANEINAHAQAQVFGWMGLFIMGFAYQAFPRFWHTTLAAPRVAVANFWLLVAGVLMASAAMPLAGRLPAAPYIATAGAAIELLSVLVFSLQIAATFRTSSKAIDPSIAYVFAALFWFSVSSLINLVHTASTTGLVLADHAVWARTVCQPVLRDIQFHGLGMGMIFGVSLRTLPALFGLPKVPPGLAYLSLALVFAGVAGEVGLFVAYKATGIELFSRLLTLPWALLLAGSLCLVVPWQLWKRFAEPDRSEKFIRAGYGWLVLSLVLLLLMPVHGMLSHAPFSHAYTGAIRHAITVGFISLMIMGYAAKVAPILRGWDPRKLSSLKGPFLMVNLGCALRVIFQISTDWSHQFFPLIGVSGTLEVAGLAWWGLHMLRMLLRSPETPVTLPAAAARLQPLGPGSIVTYVVDWYPQTEKVFVDFGFTAISNPVMRNTVGKRITLSDACRIKDVNLEKLLAALNAVVEKDACETGKRSEGGCGKHTCQC